MRQVSVYEGTPLHSRAVKGNGIATALLNVTEEEGRIYRDPVPSLEKNMNAPIAPHGELSTRPPRLGGGAGAASAALAALLFLISAYPAGAHGQQCVGIPSVPGSAFAGASAQPFTALDAEVDSDGTLGAELGVDPTGPVALRGKYRWLSVDRAETGVGGAPGGADHAVQALGTYRLQIGDVVLCPSTGGEMEIEHRTGRATRTMWRMPLGLGLSPGPRGGSSFQATPFLFPQAVLVSSRAAVRGSRTEQVEARLDFGAVFQAGRFYGTASLRVRSDLEGSLGFTRALGLTAGVRF